MHSILPVSDAPARHHGLLLRKNPRHSVPYMLYIDSIPRLNRCCVDDKDVGGQILGSLPRTNLYLPYFLLYSVLDALLTSFCVLSCTFLFSSCAWHAYSFTWSRIVAVCVNVTVFVCVLRFVFAVLCISRPSHFPVKSGVLVEEMLEELVSPMVDGRTKGKPPCHM